MDIAENSLRAGAENIDIRLVENTATHTLALEIKDDGPGMDEETLNNATNPFFTTKDGKKFGLGLSLLSQASEDAGGEMRIEKGKDRGIKITATFHTDNIDIKPIGNINKTLRVMRAAHPEVNFSFEHIREF
jgi:C4-dicarboxylate-specific signal transduction histidine kinase